MLNKTMKEIADQDYPGLDWDSVVDPETLPDIYVVKGSRRDDRKSFSGKPYVRDVSFTVCKEFETQEEAEACAERFRKQEGSHNVRVEASKPEEAEWKWMLKQCIEDEKKKEKVNEIS